MYVHSIQHLNREFRVPAKIQNLTQLLDVLRNAPRSKNDSEQVRYARANGLPHAHGEIDWSSLPVFGGDEPSDTWGVWSWDERFLLVGSCADDLRMEPREAIRSARVEIRTSLDERDEMERRARAAGLTVSEYLRRRALED